VSLNPTHAKLCDKVCQWLTTGRWFSPGTSVSSTNETDHHDVSEILLKVTLNTITLTPTNYRTTGPANHHGQEIEGI
jgi:hypothetical protein